MFLLDERAVGVCSVVRGRKDFTQRTQRKRTEFAEVRGKEELAP
jgi:hypothetical protein